MSTTTPGSRPPLDEQLRKEQQALALRAAGASYSECGRALGMDRANVHRIVMRALRREHSDAVDDLRRTEDERLDRMLKAVWTDATQGNLLAIDRALRISERRARLWGLDAPQRHVVTTELDESIDALLAEVAALPPVPTPADPS